MERRFDPSWAGTVVFALGTSYVAVTDFDGKFVLRDVPVGTWNLACSFAWGSGGSGGAGGQHSDGGSYGATGPIGASGASGP
jgi:hypothetical protein